MITYDTALKKITVRGVSKFPQEIYDYADTVEILDMSHNQLTSLPDDLTRFTNLRIAFFSGNTFGDVPSVLSTCAKLEMVGLKSCGITHMSDDVLPTSLRGLILTDNALTELPDSIGKLTNLQKLMLTGNKLPSLSTSLKQLDKLELIRVSDNELEEAPAWLADLPNLAWYADSGNRFNAINDVTPATIIDWTDITLDNKIGESAKNSVYAATLNNGQSVAVKLFGVGITTDGSPQSDVTAALRAADHPNVIGGLGTLVNAPDGQEGLIMPLIPAHYQPLGLPPNFTEYTRDHYPATAVFELSFILKVAQDIASALEHLHACGIMHGDVYAHNILSTDSGESMLGDFGAASLYDATTPSERWREILDVTGYGHMLEELLQRTTSRDDPFNQLSAVAQNCLSSKFNAQPIFGHISLLLQSL